MEKQLKIAQEVIASSKEVKGQTAMARNRALSNAQQATVAANELAEKIAGSSNSLFSAAESAENIKKLIDKAITAVVEGEMEAARALTTAAKTAANNVVSVKSTLCSIMGEAYRILFDLL
ncbi:MAG: hypothetical protein M1834_000035 [Cirrosporium novae-zelandiae]|nr:MAG: hypothetical protein M1834_000035 [Cirrosporium novae-zelandiae]